MSSASTSIGLYVVSQYVCWSTHRLSWYAMLLSFLDTKFSWYISQYVCWTVHQLRCHHAELSDQFRCHHFEFCDHFRFHYAEICDQFRCHHAEFCANACVATLDEIQFKSDVFNRFFSEETSNKNDSRAFVPLLSKTSATFSKRWKGFPSRTCDFSFHCACCDRLNPFSWITAGDRMAMFDEVLHNPDKAEFVVVSIATGLSLAETGRLLPNLINTDVAVRHVVVNQ